MRITAIHTRLMRIPFTELLRAAYGARSHASYLLVTIETDEGLIGYGEHDGLFYETAEAFIHSELKPLLIGEDPLQIEFLTHKTEHFLLWNTFAAYPMAAIDMALYDIKGKSLGVPVYEILGGLYRNKMDTTGLIHLHDVEEDVASAIRLIGQGHRVLKVKVGFDLDKDMERLAAIREAVGPAVPFRIDPNMAWSPRTAVRWIRRMEKLNLQWVEQPVPSWDIQGLIEVARAVDTPLSADESCMTVRDAWRLAEARAVEAFNVYLTEAGGITRARDILAIANTAGIACVIGTWGEGGIGQAAVLHLVASSRNFEHASDTAYGLVQDDYITEPFCFDENARLTVPHKPGLGVEPSPVKVDRYAQIEGEDRVFAQGPGEVYPALTDDPMTPQLMALVADATIYYPEYQYRVWGYGEWIALEGLLAATRILQNPRYLGFVEGLIAGWISKRDRLIPVDHVAPGVALLELYGLTGREIYLERALALARLLLDSPRSSGGARLLRPDANQHVYVDCLYSDPPLFCKLAQVTGERRWFEESAAYALEFWNVLVDAQVPLLYHGYSDASADHIGLLWGRGAGWALLGLADTLTDMPDGISGRDSLLANFRSLAAALRDLQAENGEWHTVLDHPETYLEPSIACFVCAAFLKALRAGLLDSSFEECARQSWNACTRAISEAGQILVSEATPEGDLASYQALGLGVYPWGQGPALRAIEEQFKSSGRLRPEQ